MMEELALFLCLVTGEVTKNCFQRINAVKKRPCHPSGPALNGHTVGLI